MEEKKKPHILDVSKPSLEEKEPPGPPDYEVIFKHEEAARPTSSGGRRGKTTRRETKKADNFVILFAVLLLASSIVVNAYLALAVMDLKTRMGGLEQSTEKQILVGNRVPQVTLVEATKTRVLVRIEDNGAGTKNVVIHYTTNVTLNAGLPWSDGLMLESQKGIFSYAFPFTERLHILFYIEIQDSAGNITYTRPGIIPRQ